MFRNLYIDKILSASDALFFLEISTNYLIFGERSISFKALILLYQSLTQKQKHFSC